LANKLTRLVVFAGRYALIVVHANNRLDWSTMSIAEMVLFVARL